jgi:periplasmic divalent cation tolerance protein
VSANLTRNRRAYQPGNPQYQRHVIPAWPRVRSGTSGRRWTRRENQIRLKKFTMKSATNFSLVLVTAPDLKTARGLAKAALQARLVACANLIPKIESHYWWQDKIESGAEVLLLLKTTKPNLAALEKLILAKHPYATPEFLVLPLRAGSPKYLGWLAESCR